MYCGEGGPRRACAAGAGSVLKVPRWKEYLSLSSGRELYIRYLKHSPRFVDSFDVLAA